MNLPLESNGGPLEFSECAEPVALTDLIDTPKTSTIR